MKLQLLEVRLLASFEGNNCENMARLEQDYITSGNLCEIDVITPKTEIIKIMVAEESVFVKNGTITRVSINGL